ncbi:hypothetical protein BT93_G0596 [Corymbia citriodora subsp. variegata]|nr:hypothetical protein BT93_G0596 [Corymbia citriodora subsp. variegata]
MKAIIMEEEGLGMETSEILTFPMLTDLSLKRLKSLTCFSHGKCAQESRSQNHVRSRATTLFNQEVAFQRLETLEIIGLDNFEFFFSLSMVKSLTQLKKLTISSCEKTKGIIMEEEGLGMETSEILTFPMLTDLRLEGLKSLTCFSHEKCAQESRSQNHVRSRATTLFNQEYIPIAFPIWSHQHKYFQRMKTLDVSHCHGLSNMFTSTMATNLVELTKLRISKCEILTEVISDEGGKEGHVVAFNQLKYMELDGLARLRCFSSSGYTLMFPLLEDIIVNRCPNIKFFSEGLIKAPKLERVQVGLDERYGATECPYFWKGNLNVTIQNMFEEMATFAGTKFMRLSEFPELIGKWHSELNPITSSWQLKSLVVDKCPSFINAIPSNLMLVLEKLTMLQVRDCELLEEIFDLKGLEAVDFTQALPQLQDLCLVNLPKLRQLWNRDLQGMMCFNSLQHLGLYKCSNLRHAFVSSMAQCLPNLWKIEIKECNQMEGVIADEERQGSSIGEITFPNLGQINLECLPNLTSFLSWKYHMLECPVLSMLSIAHCPKMISLTGQSLMEIDNGAPSLFTPQVQFPKLARMALSHMDSLCKIWTDGPLETLTFENLWNVEARNCKSLENLFPHWVATSLTQLHELQVESCMIEEIVMSGDDTPHSNTAQVFFPKLTSLVLHDMPRLKSFCPNLPTLSWPLLKDLRVTHCDKVNMLSFAAFKNNGTHRNDQQELSNQEAHSSLEKDFPMLERLSLVDKDISMIQDGKFPKDIFDKAKELTLACFHDEKAAFPPIFLLEKFQNLQSLEILCGSFEEIFFDEELVDEGKHPVLKNLTKLKLNKLHNLKHVWRENSLVSKILQSIENLEVSDCPCLTTIFPAMTSFQNLTYLEVKNSSGLVHLVTASAVTNLVHLFWMTIIGCERMKGIVANDENEEGKVISFQKLFQLTLQNLPSLECFSSTSCSFLFPSLWRIKVEECPKMKIFSKGTLSTPELRDVTLFKYKWTYGNWREQGEDLNTVVQKLSA